MKTSPQANPPPLPEKTAGKPIPADIVPAMSADDFIKSRIFTIRGVQVMLDRDLAVLHGVETKVLNQAVKRNAERFPTRFMFPLSEQESANMKSQIVTSSWGGRRYLPHAFTEQGVAMLASVLQITNQQRNEERFDTIFKALDGGDFPPQKVFFGGKHYDAFSFARKLVRRDGLPHRKRGKIPPPPEAETTPSGGAASSRAWREESGRNATGRPRGSDRV